MPGAAFGVGDDSPRREDAPLLTGAANYTDDVVGDDARHLAVWGCRREFGETRQ
jgi:hypothetical protein